MSFCITMAQLPNKDTNIIWYSPPAYDKELRVMKKAKVFNRIPTREDTIEFGEQLDINWFENINSGLQQALDSFRRNVLKGKAASGHLLYK